MLGLVALGLSVVMIYTLVKNALVGTQLSSGDKFGGSVELIIPITVQSEFYLEPWIQNLSQYRLGSENVKIHILIDGHHPAAEAWQELHQKLPYVELHSFLLKPLGREAVPWMIEQIAPSIKSDVVIIGDAELVPTDYVFTSIGKLVTEKQKAYFILPQTSKRTTLGEAIAVINPTLALASIFGFRRFRKNVSHPLVSISQGYMGMPLSVFQNFNWSKVNIPSWKEALAKGWDLEGKTYILAFGEKHLLRFYPEDIKAQIYQLGTYWDELWRKGERTGLALYLVVLLIWSFPLLCFYSHPFWSLASILLLTLYRFFTKIVFQETWKAMILHPFGCLVWLFTFIWWAATGIKSRFGVRRSLQ